MGVARLDRRQPTFVGQLREIRERLLRLEVRKSVGHVVAATLVVAASDARDKSRADHVCDGVADDEKLQAAIDALPA